MSDPLPLLEPECPVALLLREVRGGSRAAAEALARAVYGDLCRVARRQLGPVRDHLMDTSSLVSEAYMRIIGRTGYQLKDRRHFFAVAARIMRQILCDEARRRNCEKRGVVFADIDVDEVEATNAPEIIQLIHLDDSLNLLARISPTRATLLELKFFGALSEGEIARHLGLSLRQLQREWHATKRWLQQSTAGAEQIAC